MAFGRWQGVDFAIKLNRNLAVELRYLNVKDYLNAVKDIPTRHYAGENALLKLALVEALPANVSQVENWEKSGK